MPNYYLNGSYTHLSYGTCRMAGSEVAKSPLCALNNYLSDSGCYETFGKVLPLLDATGNQIGYKGNFVIENQLYIEKSDLHPFEITIEELINPF